MSFREQWVKLNGVDPTSVHDAILLQHIAEHAPEIDVKTAERAGSPGAFVTSWRPTKREVDIVFAVRERTDFAVRAAAVAAVCAWAQGGGWLTLSSRPGLRMAVVPSELPAIGKLRDWTQDITMTLTAYAWPMWEEAEPIEISLSGASEYTGTITVGGTCETRLEATLRCTTTLLRSAEITVGGQTMTLSGMTVPMNGLLRIEWDERHLLRIRYGTTGYLANRSGDDLILTPGTYEYSVTTNATSTVKLWARGCWL